MNPTSKIDGRLVTTQGIAKLRAEDPLIDQFMREGETFEALADRLEAQFRQGGYDENEADALLTALERSHWRTMQVLRRIDNRKAHLGKGSATW